VKPRALVLRAAARLDIDEAVAWYLAAGGPPAAGGFIAAVERAFRLARAAPEAGSPRYGRELRIAGLRHFPVPGFPWLLFYVDTGVNVEVWRLLSADRDIPAWLQDTDPLP